MNNLGLYIHVPFCKSLCPYCDFYKLRYNEEEKQLYVNTLVKSLIEKSESLATRRIDTIYFGGGTPSVLSTDDFRRIIGAICGNYLITQGAEITVECNPSSSLEELIPVLAELGVNRLSLGLQSAIDSERRGLGRLSGTDRVTECIKIAKANGIDNISLDLMIGVPNQTKESLLESLNYVKESGVPHVSAYMLKLEEGTNFYKNAERLNLPTEDETADMYITMCDYFGRSGLSQYEISNFARPGYESRHNLKYWRTEEYIGFGPASHSYLFGRRFHMPATATATDPVDDGPGGSYEERLMLALRLCEGFTGELSARTEEALKSPYLKPYIIRDSKGLRLTREGFLVSNTIIAELI